MLALLLRTLDSRSWIYREGRDRNVWALETSWRPPSLVFQYPIERSSYVRGYFDAEGGVPRAAEARFYIQFVQKSQTDLAHVRALLAGLGIGCGALHNPSRRVDPDYWRFYVRAASHADFIERIGSWHPRKRSRLECVPESAPRPICGIKATLCTRLGHAP